jgi:hypothetical protein
MMGLLFKTLIPNAYDWKSIFPALCDVEAFQDRTLLFLGISRETKTLLCVLSASVVKSDFGQV